MRKYTCDSSFFSFRPCLNECSPHPPLRSPPSPPGKALNGRHLWSPTVKGLLQMRKHTCCDSTGQTIMGGISSCARRDAMCMTPPVLCDTLYVIWRSMFCFGICCRNRLRQNTIAFLFSSFGCRIATWWRQVFRPGEYLTSPRFVWYHLYRDDIAASGKAVSGTTVSGAGTADKPAATRAKGWVAVGGMGVSCPTCSFSLCRSCTLPCWLCPRGGCISVLLYL